MFTFNDLTELDNITRPWTPTETTTMSAITTDVTLIDRRKFQIFIL